jgi:serine/threonine protein phosphatase PrpC
MDSKTATMKRLPAFGGTRKGAKQWNEDSFMTWASPNNHVVAGGVWDGHGGYFGKIASSTARDVAVAWLDKHAQECEQWSEKKWREEMKALFAHQHTMIKDRFIDESEQKKLQSKHVVDDKGIVRNGAGDPVHGGSTASFMVLVRSQDPLVPHLLLLRIAGTALACCLVREKNSSTSQ